MVGVRFAGGKILKNDPRKSEKENDTQPQRAVGCIISSRRSASSSCLNAEWLFRRSIGSGFPCDPKLDRLLPKPVNTFEPDWGEGFLRVHRSAGTLIRIWGINKNNRGVFFPPSADSIPNTFCESGKYFEGYLRTRFWGSGSSGFRIRIL